MKTGDLVVIVQQAPPYCAVGDKVNVIHGPAGARVAMGSLSPNPQFTYSAP